MRVAVHGDASWQPKKLEVKLEVPDTLDLEHLRAPPGLDEGSPLKAGEVAMPQEAATPAASAASAAPAAAEVDEGVVAMLTSMGFGENGCRRACLAAGNNVEAASEWIFAHMEDPDFNDPPTADAAGAGDGDAAAFAADPEALMMLTSMGFGDAHASAALKHCANSRERAADWLFSHADDLDAAVASLDSTGRTTGAADTGGPASGGGASGAALGDGPGRYRLRGMVSHVGKNTSSGHYVCHALVDQGQGQGEKWVIFNDSNVALSEAPPKEHAYLYLFERIEQ